MEETPTWRGDFFQRKLCTSQKYNNQLLYRRNRGTCLLPSTLMWSCSGPMPPLNTCVSRWMGAWDNPFLTFPPARAPLHICPVGCPHVQTQPIRAVGQERGWSTPLQLGAPTLPTELSPTLGLLPTAFHMGKEDTDILFFFFFLIHSFFNWKLGT